MADQLAQSHLPAQVLGEAYDKLKMFHVKLSREGEPRGIIGPRDVDIIWERHILNSAAIVPFLRSEIENTGLGAELSVDGVQANRDGVSQKKSRRVTIGDIGSGGGFPGVIIAACMPDVSVYLVEPMERRIDWLHEVVDELDLRNVSIVRARAEEIIPGRIKPEICEIPKNFKGFDIATCRAVAPMTKLTGMIFPLLRHGGELITLKGRSVDSELEKAQKEMKKFGAVDARVYEASVGEGLDSTRVLVVKKK